MNQCMVLKSGHRIEKGCNDDNSERWLFMVDTAYIA
jgi:hypothetical protein